MKLASTIPSLERFRQAENRDKVYFGYVLARKRLNLFEKRLNYLKSAPALGEVLSICFITIICYLFHVPKRKIFGRERQNSSRALSALVGLIVRIAVRVCEVEAQGWA